MVVDKLILDVVGRLDQIEKDLAKVEGIGKKSGEKTGKNFAEGFNDSVSKELKKVNEEIRRIEAPKMLEKAKKKLEDLKNGVTETTKKTMSLADAFKVVAASAVVLKIKDFFTGAIDFANKFQQSLLKVVSSAKAYGESVIEAKQASRDLAEDGFLNLKQSATAVSNLMASGLNVEQAKKFVTATKDISAFGNTIGDAGQSVEDLTKGILTNSAEVVENLSPAMKTINSQYQEQVKTVGKAKAVQFLYNETLKLSTKFTGDAAKFLQTAEASQKRFTTSVENAKAAIGEGLQPALVAIINVVKPLIDGFTKWFSGLSKSSKVIALLGGAMTLLVPVIWSAVSALGAMALTMSPILLTIIGITAAITALAVVYNELNPSLDEITKKHEKETETIQQLRKEYEKDKKLKNEVVKVNSALAKSADTLGISLRKENGHLKTNIELLEEVKKAKLKNLQVDFLRLSAIIRTNAAKIKEQRIALNELRIQEQKAKASGSSLTAFTTGSIVEGLSKGLQDLTTDQDKAIKNFLSLNKQIIQLQNGIDITKKKTKDDGGVFGKPSKALLKDNQFLVDDFQKKLDAQMKAYRDFIAFVQQQNKKGKLSPSELASKEAEATSKLIEIRKQLEAEQKKITNEATLSRFELEKEKLEETRDAQIKAAENVAKARKQIEEDSLKLGITNVELANKRKLEAEKDFAEDKKKIDADYRKKKTELDIKQIQEVLSKTETVLSGAKTALTAQTGGDFLGGIGSAVSVVDPAIGGAIQGVGGIVSFIEGISGFGEESKRIEEERERLLENQKILLEAQNQAVVAQRKNLELINQLEIDRGNLIDKETSLQIKLNAIEFSEDAQARRQADIDTLTALKVQKEQDIGLEGGTAQEVGSQIKDLFDVNLANKAALEMLAAMPQVQAGSSTRESERFIASRQSETIDKILETNISDGLRKTFERLRDRVTTFGLIEAEVAGVTSFLRPEQQALLEKESDAKILLDTLKQIQDLSGQTATNTAETATNTAVKLTPDRERSIIDIGMGYISSLGQKIIGPTTTAIMSNMNAQNFTLPTEVGQASSMAIQARTLQERVTDAVEKGVMQRDNIITILERIQGLNAALVSIMDGNTGSSSQIGITDLMSLQANIDMRNR